MDLLKTLQALGFSLPSPAYFFGAVVFGLTGYTVYQWGQVAAREPLKWIGAALMLLSFLVSATWQLYAIGAFLCALVPAFRPVQEGDDELPPPQESE